MQYSTAYMNLSPGARLGPYEIVSLLGAGGMGEVYRARDTRLLRDVAVKVLPASLVTDEDRLRRFEVEARAASLLSHPNIVALYDVGRHDDSPFVVSELLEGETLRQRLDGGPLSHHRALEYGIQIAQGLAAAHEKGVVHRDLKPENLFVTEDGHVKILDFGLAKLARDEGQGSGEDSATMTRQTDPGKVLGTVGYMSPEQVRGKAADHRSDIFSFGAILYEMLSGRRAFKADSAVETLNAILKTDPPDLLDTGRPLPPGLERIVRHCLEKTSADRFQSARDLAFDLQSVSAASGSGTLRAATSGGPGRGLRRALVAVLLVALLGSAFLLGRGSRSASSPAYKLVTFRLGYLSAARFAGSSGTFLYSASWYGQPQQIFAGRIESPDARPLGVASATLRAVTATGEMAVTIRSSSSKGLNTLARVSVEGGAPRELLEDVAFADWSRDGSDFAVVRVLDGRIRLEFPIGTVLYQAVGAISHPRISPDGSRVAFLDHPMVNDDRGAVAVVDRLGHKTVLSDGWSSSEGLAWSPDGREVWFTAARTGADCALQAVSLSGKQRLLAAAPGRLVLHDVAPDGRVLLARNNVRAGMMVRPPGEAAERDLTWHDYSYVSDLSADGRWLLFSETGEAGGERYGVYLRGTDGSPAVRLGEGRALALSPDAGWAVSIPLDPPSRLLLLPTRAGASRTLASPEITRYQWASFFPDGKRLLVLGNDTSGALRLFAQDIESGGVRAITPPGVATRTNTISPDGTRLIAVAIGPGSRPAIYPIDGGPPTPLPAAVSGEEAVRWGADGHSVLLASDAWPGVRVSRLDLVTGVKQVVRELKPADTAGFIELASGVVSADGSAYAYTDKRVLSDLYIVDGVR